MRIMSLHHHVVVLLLIVLACNLSMSIGGNVNVTCIETERKALAVFKQSLTDPSNLLSSWVGQDCCSWDYVVCNNVTGHVVELNPLPPDFNLLIGSEVSPSLAELKYLEHLSLSMINFSGSKIPSFFGSFKSLRSLDLSYTSFAGVVPPFLGNLSTLENFNLGNLDLLKIDNLNWLSQLSNLQVLNLSYVNLSQVSNPSVVFSSFPFMSELILDDCGLNEFPLSSLSYANLSNVKELHLAGNFFSGQLPDWFTHLPNIHILDLSDNSFSGLIPSSFFTKTLKELRLNSNQLNGTIPESMGQLSSLEWLDLSDNSLSGLVSEIHFEKLSSLTSLYMGSNFLLKIDNLNWLSQLSNLQVLHLSYVNLSQVSNPSGVFSSFPFMSELFLDDCGLNEFPLSSLSYANLSNVKELYLGGNHISGQLPDWVTHLPNIHILDLSVNSFSGLIPSSFFTKTLKELYLGSNQLNGTIPESMGQLSSLELLDLSDNSLSGLVSEIHFEKLSSLTSLYMGSNFLALNVSIDWVPPFQLVYLDMGSWKFENGSLQWLETQKRIYRISIPDAKISGAYHFEDIVQLLNSDVVKLDLSNCSISGSIPRNIGNVMPNLTSLTLAHNYMSGRIPTSVCGISKLWVLDLTNNHLSGDLPQSCWSHPTLTVLDLSSNNLTGVIPSSIGNQCSFVYLRLSNNKFSGELPVAMETCTEMEILDIANNGFSGNLPAWTDGLAGLKILNLRSNNFDGSLSNKLCSLSNLQILDMAHNSFIGTIPDCFGNFSGMTWDGSTKHYGFTEYESYLIRLIQVMKGRELEYTEGPLALLVSLDLSSNNLAGNIPEELMFLSGLHTFNLSHNRLTGVIPEKISNLKSLESLDLSHNHLTGMIPQSFSELNYLTVLNLSYNNLSGKIPTGNQLQTLDPSSYEGNQDLCGTQIGKNCTEEPFEFIDHSGKANEESEKFLFYIGLIVGTVVGFWGVCGALLFKRTWRHNYFRFVQNVYDMLIIKFLFFVFLLKRKFDQ